MLSNLARTRQDARSGRAPLKRLGDIAIACTLLLITLPLMVLVALSIKYESAGPIFEGTERLGPNGRFFRSLTFRTVARGCERLRRKWPPQMTYVGSFLHFTRIEYLPQLINVLRGELSLFDSDSHRSFFRD
jgi:lipopolysaccharide/colanic/teichoic acid biosynthesis glycosyltransferase